MDALAKFVSEAIYSPVTCLGVSLRPFSRGHYWLLAKIQSPLLFRRQSEQVELTDLMRAVIICSQDFDGGMAALSDPALGEDLKFWARRIEGKWIGKFMPKRTARRIARAALVFRSYLRAGVAEPYLQFQQTGGSESKFSSDWSMLSVVACMKSLRMPFKEAVNMHAPLARWLIAIQGERDGTCEILDKDERAALKREADEIAREVFGDDGGQREEG